MSKHSRGTEPHFQQAMSPEHLEATARNFEERLPSFHAPQAAAEKGIQPFEIPFAEKSASKDLLTAFKRALSAALKEITIKPGDDLAMIVERINNLRLKNPHLSCRTYLGKAIFYYTPNNEKISEFYVTFEAIKKLLEHKK